MPSSCSSRSEVGGERVDEVGLDGVLDDRVALLGDLGHVRVDTHVPDRSHRRARGRSRPDGRAKMSRRDARSRGRGRGAGRLGPGDVVTYGEVAAEAGYPGAARAVGRFLATHDGTTVVAGGHRRRGAWCPSTPKRARPPAAGRGRRGRNGRSGVDTDLHGDLRPLDPPPRRHAPPTSSDYEGKATLVVNVASKCGLTPQYTGLEKLHERYAGPGLHRPRLPLQPVHGPGAGHRRGDRRRSARTTYGVTFPLFEKIDVNGDDRHPLYDELTPGPPTPRATPATSAGTSRSSSSTPAAMSSPASAPPSTPRPPSSSTPSNPPSPRNTGVPAGRRR